jgi:hypothetical protein
MRAADAVQQPKRRPPELPSSSAGARERPVSPSPRKGMVMSSCDRRNSTAASKPLQNENLRGAIGALDPFGWPALLNPVLRCRSGWPVPHRAGGKPGAAGGRAELGGGTAARDRRTVTRSLQLDHYRDSTRSRTQYRRRGRGGMSSVVMDILSVNAARTGSTSKVRIRHHHEVSEPVCCRARVPRDR